MTHGRAIFLLFGSILVILLSGCTSVSVEADGKERRKSECCPLLAKIDDLYRVAFAVRYDASIDTKLCKEYAPLAGVWLQRTDTFYYDVASINGQYSVELPLSEVQPGGCDWKPYAIMFSISEASQKSDGYGALVSIDEPDGKQVTSITYSCNRARFRPNSEPFVFCRGNPSPLLKTITKDQKSLEVNFVATPGSAVEDLSSQ